MGLHFQQDFTRVRSHTGIGSSAEEAVGLQAAQAANPVSGGATLSKEEKQKKLGRAEELRAHFLRKSLVQLRQVEITLEKHATHAQLWEFFAPTLWSFRLWLKVGPEDTGFPKAVHESVRLVRENLRNTAKIVEVADDFGLCAAPSVIAFFGNGGVNVCSRSYARSATCLANAVAHEIFHLVGLAHGSVIYSPGSHPCDAVSTTDQSLTNPWCMTDFAFQVAEGSLYTFEATC